MHEGAIAESILNSVLETAKNENLKNICKVSLIIGKMHHIVDEVLITYYDHLKMEHKNLEKSFLFINEKEIKIECSDCKAVSIIDAAPIFFCSECQSFSTKMIQGEELLIESIEGLEEE